MKTPQKVISQSPRLISLDFMRGLIMVLLMLESTRLYDHLIDVTAGYNIQNLFIQFTHHPWNGLRFWDIIQPGFMFIAGASLALSLTRQQQAGIHWKSSFKKVLKRSLLLFFWGVLIYAVRPGGLSFELWNVLTQLSATTLIAFLIFRWSFTYQVLFSIGLLLFTEFLYRFTSVPGFDQPFTDQHNIGNYIDLLLMGKINARGWVAINFIPTACHTIWGALAGKLLLSEKKDMDKVQVLFFFGIGCIVSGHILDATLTPIIKRIATSSFVLASGGWCLIGLAFLYFWIDIKNHKEYLRYVLIVGMNSLFIYLFFETIGTHWLDGFIDALTFGLLEDRFLPTGLIGITSSLLIFFIEWWLCWFLYKNGIFIKI